MERIQLLIDKLVTQKAAGASASELLLTVQFIQQELLKGRETAPPLATAGVVVTMPGNYAVIPGVDVEEYLNREYVTLDVEEAEEEEAQPAPVNNEGRAGYVLKKPVVEERPPVKEEPPREQPAKPEPPKEQPKKEAPPYAGTFAFDDVAEETPTLLHQPNRGKKELHEVIGKSDPSLNDKLKEEKTELAHTLKDSPVKDLRKAIGVNDKFLFINELFRGDEAMYDRSIKTINGFQILAEAEYWITRELKVKLGWNEKNETVKHFDQVVRRRFS